MMILLPDTLYELEEPDGRQPLLECQYHLHVPSTLNRTRWLAGYPLLEHPCLP